MAEVNINGGEAEYALADHSEYKRKMEPYQEYRVGNFKVRLVRLQINDKGDARVLNKNAHFQKSFLEKNHWEEIYAVEVKTLEEKWSVRIPQDYGLFSLIVSVIRWDNKEAEDRLGTIFGNIFTVSCVPDGFYHNLVAFLTTVLVDHLDKKSSWKEKRDKYDKLIADFKWYLDADLETYKPEKEKEWTEKEYHQAEVADEAKQVLEKEARNGQ